MWNTRICNRWCKYVSVRFVPFVQPRWQVDMSDWSPKENLVRECCFRIVRMYLNSEFNPSALHSSYFRDPTPQWCVVLYIVPETREFEQRTFQPELLCRGMQHPHRNTEGLHWECGWAKGYVFWVEQSERVLYSHFAMVVRSRNMDFPNVWELFSSKQR